jgi:hypothetical protein
MSCTWTTISIYYNKLQKKLFQNSFIWKSFFWQKWHVVIFSVIPLVHCIPFECCIFRQTNQILCTLTCKIGVKLNTCKRWFHLYMHLSKSKISSCEENVLVGGPKSPRSLWPMTKQHQTSLMHPIISFFWCGDFSKIIM